MNARKTRLDGRTAYNYGLKCPFTRAANAAYFRTYRQLIKIIRGTSKRQLDFWPRA